CFLGRVACLRVTTRSAFVICWFAIRFLHRAFDKARVKIMNSAFRTPSDAIRLVQTKRKLTSVASAYRAHGVIKLHGRARDCSLQTQPRGHAGPRGSDDDECADAALKNSGGPQHQMRKTD